LAVLFLFSGCQSRQITQRWGKRINLVWSSEEFLKGKVPKNLSLSEEEFIPLDLYEGKEKEIVFASLRLPFIYILSPQLRLLGKLNAFSFLPKGIETEMGDFLFLTNGKEIKIFTKKGRNLSEILSFRLSGRRFVRDFALGYTPASSPLLLLWTIEEERGGDSLTFFIVTYQMPLKNRGQLHLSSEERITGKSKDLRMRVLGSYRDLGFFWLGKEIYLRGRENFQVCLPPMIGEDTTFLLMKSAFSSVDEKLFLLFSSPEKSRLLSLSLRSGEMEEIPLSLPPSSRANDFLLSDIDGDSSDEVLISYSGRRTGVLLLKGKNLLKERGLSFIGDGTLYFLGEKCLLRKKEILLTLSLGTSWFYRLSPQLKVREVSDLEGTVSAFTFLPNGFLIVGEGFNQYQWE
jgi:hypothetical protein